MPAGRATAVLALSVALAGCASPGHLPPATHRAAAEQVADRLLARVSVPAVLHRVADGARYGLGDPATEPVSDRLVDLSHVWTGRATADAVMTFVAHHLPAGARATGSTATTDGSVPGSSHVPSIGSVTYSLDRRWQDPGAYTGLELQLTYTVRNGRVAVRADAQVIYLPTRTADRRVPTTRAGTG